jgi:hypothetical protein
MATVVRLQSPTDGTTLDFDTQRPIPFVIVSTTGGSALPAGSKVQVGYWKSGMAFDENKVVWTELTVPEGNTATTFTINVSPTVPGDFAFIARVKVQGSNTWYYSSKNDEAIDNTDPTNNEITLTLESNSSVWVQDPVNSSDQLLVVQDREIVMGVLKSLMGGKYAGKSTDFRVDDLVVGPKSADNPGTSGKKTFKISKDKYGTDSTKYTVVDVLLIYTNYDNLTALDTVSIYRETSDHKKVPQLLDVQIFDFCNLKYPLVFKADEEYTIEVNLVQPVVGTDGARFGFRFRGWDIVTKDAML